MSIGIEQDLQRNQITIKIIDNDTLSQALLLNGTAAENFISNILRPQHPASSWTSSSRPIILDHVYVLSVFLPPLSHRHGSLADDLDCFVWDLFARWRRILDAGPIGRRAGIDVIRGANPARVPRESAGSTCARVTASVPAPAPALGYMGVSNSLCAPSIIVGIYDYYAHADFARARRRVAVVAVVVGHDATRHDATRRDNTIIVIPAVNTRGRAASGRPRVRGRLSTRSLENEFIIIVIIVIVILSFFIFSKRSSKIAKLPFEARSMPNLVILRIIDIIFLCLCSTFK